MACFVNFLFDFGMCVFGTLLTLTAIFLPIYGPMVSRICALSMGIGCIFYFLLCNISVRRFDKKYKKKLLAHKKAKDLVYVSFFFSPETSIQLKPHRMPVYLYRLLKKDPRYRLKKEILPEYSYKEVKIIDKILFAAFLFFGVISLITGIISIALGYV